MENLKKYYQLWKLFQESAINIKEILNVIYIWVINHKRLTIKDYGKDIESIQDTLRQDISISKANDLYYSFLTPNEYLTFIADLLQIDEKVKIQRIEDLLKSVIKFYYFI